jgi:hypothetical protein
MLQLNRRIPVLLLAILTLTGCGTQIPTIEEAWEEVGVTPDLEQKIKFHIFCQTVEALRKAQKVDRNGVKGLLDDFGVQVQLTLTVEETGAINPNIGFPRTLENMKVSGVTVPQSVSLNVNGTLSSSATTVHTSYAYYNVKKISDPGRNTWCEKERDMTGSSLLLISDLGIKAYLPRAVQSIALLPSSAPVNLGAGKTAKLDVISYEVKFVVISSAGFNPVIKLATLATGGSGNIPLASIGRTRTHQLILTFGPGTDKPLPEALLLHTRPSQQPQPQPIPSQ